MNKLTKENKVVVTGLGIITPIGIGVDSFWDAVIAGKSGISLISRFDMENYPTKIAGEIRDFYPENYMSEELKNFLCRSSQLGVAAAQMALDDARLNLSNVRNSSIGITIGLGAETLSYYDEKTAIEENNYTLRSNPPIENRHLTNIISDIFHLSGQNVIVATACSSGNQAIGIARDMIQSGQADIVLAGGVEAPIFPLYFASFCSLRIMSKRNDQPEKASRPFDKERDGFVMGEGAGILVIESAENAHERGAPIYAEIAGYGATSDAFHMTMPSRDRKEICKAMRSAIQDAGLDMNGIDYINAHGTSTPANDSGETMAIKTVFGDRAYDIPVSSTKSMTGHLIGAAGAVELITCILAMKNSVIPPTINLEHPSPDCDLDYVANEAREKEIRTALSNSFGFGGNNSTIVVKKVIQ
ncbi:MAG: beta-ketoacyl-ACP synthase II [Candidatus Brocadiaceae bacterium]|nr:beta-ketoacyl-ACP synthase II [Candidatus Brocadiaceae bacterium]